MKKNWVALVSVALNLVLIVMVLGMQSSLEGQIRRLSSDVESIEHNVDATLGNVTNRVQRAVEEATKQVKDYELLPTGIDKETQELQAILQVDLSQWQEDTMVMLEAAMGSNKHMMSLPVENGTCAGPISIPLNQSSELEMEVVVTSGGVSKREHLGSWADVSMLLPIQRNSWGGSMPDYIDGQVIMNHFDTSVCDQRYAERAVEAPGFRVYLNDQLVLSPAATVTKHDRHDSIMYECEPWTLDAEIEDKVKLTFLCEDEYGLGYEFVMQTWIVKENGPNNGRLDDLPYSNEDEFPRLRWE